VVERRIASSIAYRCRVKSQNEEERLLDRGGYVYFIKSTNGAYVKIGFSTVENRLRELDASLGSLELLGYFPGTRRTEQWLHAKFRVDRKNGEWFRLSPSIREFIRHMGLIGSHSRRVATVWPPSRGELAFALINSGLIKSLRGVYSCG
jgi:hypothetical protein